LVIAPYIAVNSESVSKAMDGVNVEMATPQLASELPVSDAIKNLGDKMDKALSSGVTLNIPENGIESNLLKFIEDKSKPVDKTTWFDFDRLTFETGKSSLKSESAEQLKNIAEILKAYPDVNVKVGGYTDNQGDANANLTLSSDRASAVKAELIKLGIDDSRLESEGYGVKHPIASNDTEEGRAANRRTSVRVTKK
jgi:K(+)-stimulated pyrophosphate-energized sodium pump